MARRCGCASETCSCIITEGEGITVTGTGAPGNPYVVHSNVTDIETGIDVQYNNANIILDAHRIDFRGSAVTVSAGVDEAVVTVTVPDPTTGAVIPTGAIWMFGMTGEPAGWLLCDGRTNLLIATYTALFGVIGTRWGGNGTTTFGVPNMMDSFPIGTSPTKSLGTAGGVGGSAVKKIAVANLPPHSHPIDHNHPAKNTSSAGGHDHALGVSGTAGSSGSAVHQGNGDIVERVGPIHSDGSHVHSYDTGPFNGTTSGTTNATQSNFDIMPPWTALAFMIKT